MGSWLYNWVKVYLFFRGQCLLPRFFSNNDIYEALIFLQTTKEKCIQSLILLSRLLLFSIICMKILNWWSRSFECNKNNNCQIKLWIEQITWNLCALSFKNKQLQQRRWNRSTQSTTKHHWCDYLYKNNISTILCSEMRSNHKKLLCFRKFSWLSIAKSWKDSRFTDEIPMFLLQKEKQSKFAELFFNGMWLSVEITLVDNFFNK